MEPSSDTTGDEFMTPESLERICLGYEPRIFSEAPFEDPETRLWPFQYAKWSMLGDASYLAWTYSPGDSCGAWYIRPVGRKLCLDALRWLVRRGAIRVRRKGKELRLAEGDPKAWWNEYRLAWAWLDERTATKDGDR